MLAYDHRRTEQIVNRLRDAERVARVATLGGAVATFAAAGALLSGLAQLSAPAALTSMEPMAVGAVVGGVCGLLVGASLSVVVSAVIEWMDQVLIAHGQVLDALPRGRAHSASAPHGARWEG
jgi:hypothetical protein